MKKLKTLLKFLANSFWNLILNDVANLLGGALIAVLSTGVLIFLVGLFWLLRFPILSTPIHLLLIAALTGLAVAAGIYSVPGLLRQIHWTGLHELAGFSWQFNYGELVDGPFCIHCGEIVKEISGDLDSRFHAIMLYQDDVAEHSCGKTIPHVPDIDYLKRNVAAAVFLHIKLGKSVTESLPDLPVPRSFQKPKDPINRNLP